MYLYAQLDENNVCHTVSTVKTNIPATYDNIGSIYENGVFKTLESIVENESGV